MNKKKAKLLCKRNGYRFVKCNSEGFFFYDEAEYLRYMQWSNLPSFDKLKW